MLFTLLPRYFDLENVKIGIMQMKEGRTIVVFGDHGIGDLLLMVPLLRNCASNLAEKDLLIIIVKTQREVEVVNSIHLVGNIEVWEAGYYGLERYIKLAKVALVFRMKHPDIVLVPLFADRFRNALLVRFIGSKISIGPYGKWGRFVFNRYIRQQTKLHKVERFFQIGIKAGLKQQAELNLTLPVSRKLKERVREMMPDWRPDQHWLAFSIGTGPIEIHKRWPIEHFQKLAHMLINHSSKIRIAAFGSHAERELLESVFKNEELDINRCFVYAGQTFDLSIAFLSQCRCLVGGCSGPAHMAAAAGIPIVGLFGPTNPGFTGPYSKRLHVVQTELECSPCYRVGFIKGCGEPICMSLIKPQTVFMAVLNALHGDQSPPVPWTETTQATRPSKVTI